MKNPIKRHLESKIIENLWKEKVIIVYGARQVGKTTLVKKILAKYEDISLYLNCDEPDVREALANKTSTELKGLIGKKTLVVIDEAQRVMNIGLSLKLLIDNFPEIQIIATGSSSFDLSNKIKEPLTGRKYEFYLYPLSVSELSDQCSALELNRILEQRMVYGMYPEIVNKSNEVAETDLRNLANSYLFKDVLQYQNIKNPEILEKLLQALALQIGNEVSYNELGGLLGIDKATVASYIRILEQAFIVFRLPPLSRNIRSELKKLRKIYFYDTGMRNALINNLNPLSLRNDTGALWENFLISERKKQNHYSDNFVNSYFWRTHQQQEIDYIEEKNSSFIASEFKWGKKKALFPKIFLENYKNATTQLVNRDNWMDFILG
ncbi:ATPase [Candidatus Peregrinibacteria bacterium]|nr:MAG: ATPase [Candidatus Peregrinibacteria bacterium]